MRSEIEAMCAESQKTRTRTTGKSSEKIEPAAPTTRWSWVLSAGLLTAVTLAVYWQVLGFDFVNYDDYLYVTQNPHVQQGLTTRSIAWAFTTTHASNWHPLTWLSLMLDRQLFGSGPMGFHITNLVFHLANTLLLLWALTRMTGSLWKSTFVSALFAVHPLHVESVAWVVERKDVLSTFFWFLSILAYLHYTDRPKFRRYLLVVLAFVLGLMAKPMLVTLPFVLPIIDYWPLQRFGAKKGVPWSKLALEKIPLLLISLASGLVTIVAQSKRAMGSFESYPLALRLSNAVLSYAVYIAKAVWPSKLACFYPYEWHISTTQLALAAFFLAFVTALALRQRDRRPYLTAGWLWYLVTLLPAIGLIQVGAQSRADRYTYVPLVGIFVMIAWGVPSSMEKLLRRYSKLSKQMVLSSISVAVVIALAGIARVQASYWKDGKSLFKHALDVAKPSSVAERGYAQALAEEGRVNEALKHYQASLRLDPHDARTYNGIGLLLADNGQLEDAIVAYRQALRCDPGFADAHNNLGNALAKTGSFEEAIEHYKGALELDPSYAEAHGNLAVLYTHMGRFDEAIRQYEEALALDPGFVEAKSNLAALLAQQGNFDDAIRLLTEAIKMKVDFADAHVNLALVYYQIGEYSQAWHEANLAQKYGAELPQEFVEEIGRKLSNP